MLTTMKALPQFVTTVRMDEVPLLDDAPQTTVAFASLSSPRVLNDPSALEKFGGTEGTFNPRDPGYSAGETTEVRSWGNS